jgi:Predicted nucleic acid-binding protein, contains PIN domain
MNALDKTQKYGLLITDAVYVTVMENNKIKHIASDDKDFQEVKEITLWKP